MKTLRFVICDVFTDKALAGNQLAVFTNATDLDAATMQALARETNFSETTFVLPAEAGGDARVRIFTPRREIPFAGHPTLGTAYVLAAPLQRPIVRLETGAGIVPVAFESAGTGARVAFGWMQQPVPHVEPFAEPERLLAALGVASAELPVELYDNGAKHVMVMLPSREAVATVRPDWGQLEAVVAFGVSTFAGEGTRWKTRMFAPAAGVPEDPATGSAAGPLAVHLVRHGRARAGEEIVIDQGVEIGRPSRLHARVHGTAERIETVEVGGAAVMVARGEFVIP